MNSRNNWHDSVPTWEQFELDKAESFSNLAKSTDYRKKGLELLNSLNQYGFSHKNSWLGVPIIRLPEDILFQQELIAFEKPDLIIEIGIARGGGLLLSASIQELCGINPDVIGIDNKVYPHTIKAISESRYSDHIKILEGNSTEMEVFESLSPMTTSASKILLVLDSDHSSSHVLKELELYVPILPVGSIIIICDTIIDELPAGTYPNRTWSDGRGPRHGLKIFMEKSKSLILYKQTEVRSLILSEIRDGVLKKVVQ
jgi:cephalosporin hydroxylase